MEPEEIIRPTFLWYPDRQGSYLDEVIDLAKMMGRPLDAEQCIAVDALTSHGAHGRWLTLETGLKEPRQNGKTAGIATPIVLADLFLWDADQIFWTAHLFKTAREAFRDHVMLIQSCSDLEKRVRKITYANGEEGVELTSGAKLSYVARSKGGARGQGAKRVVIDEALFFTGEQGGALLPTLAARDNPQVMYLSSACKVESEHLRNLTVRGRSGNDPSLIWVEWKAPGSFANPGCVQPKCMHLIGTPGCVLDNLEYLRQANPATRVGRISMEFLQSMRRAMPPIEYAREFLGWDEDAEDLAGVTIPLDAWEARTDPESRITGPRAIAFDISPDRRSSAIAGAGRRSDGDVHLSLIDHRSGTSWLVPRLLDLIERHDPVAVVVDGMSPAGTEIKALEHAGIPVKSQHTPSGTLQVLGAQDMARACGLLYDAVAGDEPDAWHRGDPILATALTGAARRDIGDGGWAFGRRRSDADISPLVAVTQAHYALVTSLDMGPLVAWR